MRIPPDHPALAGHFPGHSVVPGVLLLAHVEAALRAQIGDAVRIAAMPAAKFRAMVAPGEIFDVRLAAAGNGQFKFEIHATGRLCVSGTLTTTSA